MTTALPFNLLQHPLRSGFTLVEASAGTGKTYSITWLVARLLLEYKVDVSQLLVVTFTIAATEELRTRIRDHLNELILELDDLNEGSDLWTLLNALPPEDQAQAQSRLQEALDRFEEAQISTIHGFCSSALRDFGIEAGVETRKVNTHIQPLLDEIIDDYRSLILSSASLNALRVMESHRTSLRVQRSDLVEIAQKLEKGGWSAILCDPLYLIEGVEYSSELLDCTEITPSIESDSPADLSDDHHVNSQTPKNSRIQIHHIVEAWDKGAQWLCTFLDTTFIPQLSKPEVYEHFYEAYQELEESALWRKDSNTPKLKAAVDVLKDLMEEWNDDRSRLSALLTRLQSLSYLTTTWFRKQQLKKSAHADFSHPLTELFEQLTHHLDLCLKSMRTWFRKGCVEYLTQMIPQRKHEGGWMSTDDLIHLTHHALTQSTSGTPNPFRAALQNRFRAALIDEFQDTDPAQWGIFEAIFHPQQTPHACPVYLIGDPKQSIYRFRGADLNAYLSVKLQVDPERRFTMSRNFRSDPRVLNALNQLFDPYHDEFTVDHWQSAPPGTPSQNEGYFEDEHVPYIHVDGGRPNRLESAPALRWVYFDLELKANVDEHLMDFVAEDVCRFLKQNHQIGHGDKKRPVHVGDIGILVRKNDRAKAVAQALAKRGIAAKIRSDYSVFKTITAQYCERLLRGILMPNEEETFKAALSVPLLGLTAIEVRESADALHDLFLEIHQQWFTQSLATAFQTLLYHPQLKLTQRILSQPDGAQHLTHLMHVVERIQYEANRLQLGPELALQWLREKRLAETTETEEVDQIRPHIEEAAVEVVTIHSSKGLEYPILFCPDLSVIKTKRKMDIVELEPDEAGQAKALDLRLDEESPPLPLRKEALERVHLAQRREERRLTYVALTRAVHHCSIYFSIKRGCADGQLYPLLMGSRAKKKYTQAKLNESFRTDFQERFTHTSNEIVFEVVDEWPEFTRLYEKESPHPPLAVHEHPTPSNPHWKRASFSALSRLIQETSSLRQFLGEDREIDESEILHLQKPISYEGPLPPLASAPKNSRFGLCLHEILENLDFQCTEETLHHKTVALLRVWNFSTKIAKTVSSALWTALHTPLGSPLKSLQLADIPVKHRRDEVRFEIKLTSPTPLSAPLLNGILALDPQCHQLAPFPQDFQWQGFLKGTLDLLFKHPQSQQYWIGDYKSNWLGEHQQTGLAFYHPLALHQVMIHHLYLLQSHLYLLALHRLLKERLGTRYDFQTHFGGSIYLFLRGLCGQESQIPSPLSTFTSSTPSLSSPSQVDVAGVYIHTPPRIVIELLDLAFKDARTAQDVLTQIQNQAHSGLPPFLPPTLISNTSLPSSSVSSLSRSSSSPAFSSSERKI